MRAKTGGPMTNPLSPSPLLIQRPTDADLQEVRRLMNCQLREFAMVMVLGRVRIARMERTYALIMPTV